MAVLVGGTGSSVNIGVDISVYSPLIRTEYVAMPIYTYYDNLTSYSHTLNAFGGFGDAKIDIRVDQEQIDDWIENGIGRHIVCRGHLNQIIYEGFVQEIDISYGGLSVKVGPLFDVGNRVTVVYTPILDIGTDPPTKGTSTETPIAEDTDSQERFGIIEKILSGGELLDDGTTDAAEELRDLYLQEFKYPFTDNTVTIGAGGAQPTVSLTCNGYDKWLDAYAYNYPSILSTTITDKLLSVIAADPNDIFNPDISYINDNLNIVPEDESENRMAYTVIKELLSYGDGSDNRWLFGVYDNRTIYFDAMPSDVHYRYYITDDELNINDKFGNRVYPWDVRPGRWAYLPDVLLTRYPPLDSNIYRKDQRMIFIETVSYSAPYTVTLNGNRVSKVSQRLAQLGLRGY